MPNETIEAVAVIALGLLLLLLKIDKIQRLLEDLVRKEVKQMKELEDLKAQVEKNTEVESSAIALIQGIAAELAAAKEDPAAIAALSERLNTSATALAAAITANTPAAPPAA